jgi:tetratricopeptide (TPR) repeat protein
MSVPKKTRSDSAQLAATIGLLILLPVLAWREGRAGYASLLSFRGAQDHDLALVDRSVALNPADAESLYFRAVLLEAGGDVSAANSGYARAVSIRPDDYVLWLNLARARELDGDTEGALAAAQEAVPLAPSYAQPHWQLGNLLVRVGQRDEGFKELRQAGSANPVFLPAIVEMAWQLSHGDVALVKQLIQPINPKDYQALAESFRKHGKAEESIVMFGSAGVESQPLRQQYLNQLISAKQFKEAYALWLQGRPADSAGGLGVIIDPGFEQESNLDEPGFGWRNASKSTSLSLSLDPDNPKTGRSSLLAEFKGDAGSGIISQLVMVGPGVHYQLSFAARADQVVSGGLPGVTVTDGGDNAVLGQPVVLPQQADNWQHYTIDFKTKPNTQTIQIALRRDGCNSPCPIFGRVWLDDFSLKVVSEARP